MKNLKYIIIVPLSILSIILFIFSIKKINRIHNKIHKTTTIEKWTQQDFNILFMSKEQTKQFLLEDKDEYVKRLSQIDLYARKANNAEHYISNITKCASFFSDAEKKKLIRCAKLADNFLNSYTYNNDIKGSEIAKIPWKIAVTRKNGVNQYEEGLPHTRSDVIFLSEYVINDNIAIGEDDMILTNTLVHEKVHIYQRYNSDIIGEVINKMGYKVAAPGSDTLLKRSNPDTNDKNYYDKNNELIIFEYNSQKPENINDVKDDNFSSEHPYEKMAYDIANEYTKKTMNNITNKII
jgi:hypothetical protein